jgi:hypothetical protein
MIAILGYASIFHLQGDMDATYYPNFAYPATYVVPLGSVRALAGMAVGCMMHLFVESHGEMLAARKNMPLLTLTEVVTGVIILYGFLFNHHNHSDFIYVILLPIFLVCVCSKNTLWGPLTNRAGQVLEAVFGRQYTLAVFCLQIFADRLVKMTAPGIGILLRFHITSQRPVKPQHLIVYLHGRLDLASAEPAADFPDPAAVGLIGFDQFTAHPYYLPRSRQ